MSLIPESFFLYSPSPAMAGQGGNTPVVPGSDLFNQMPSEVVLLVFKWLPKCTLAKSARGESAQIIKNFGNMETFQQRSC